MTLGSSCSMYPRETLIVNYLVPNRLSSSRSRTTAARHKTIHFRSEIYVRFILRTNHRVVHHARLGIDAHALKDIKRARHIVRRDIPWLHRLAEILPAAVIGDFLRLFGIDIDSFSKHPLSRPLRHHFEALPAAHPLLQIVPPFRESIFNDRQHWIVPLRE